MAFSSIKVRDEDKRAFDRLRHEVALQSGRELTQHELFHRIVEVALESKSRVLVGPAGQGRPSWTRFQFELGAATDATRDLDETVYGLGP